MCRSSPHFNVVQRKNLAIDIQFTTAPAAAMSVVCYGELETPYTLTLTEIFWVNTSEIVYTLEQDHH